MTETILHCEEAGRGKGGVFVFLHGFMGNCRSLRSVIAPLAQGRRCVAFDLPGHGRSRFGQSERLQGLRSMEDGARLILADLETLGIERFSLYGYSMGGRIAQTMALLAPGRIERLILESASFGIDDPGQRKARHLRDRELLAGIRTQEEFAAFLDRWYRLPLFRTLRGTPHLPEIIREKMGNDVSELRWALGIFGVGNHPFLAGRLAGLGLPIHYFYGELDEAYADAGRNIRTRLPELAVREFSGASHDIHSQFPEKILEAIFEILSSGEKEKSDKVSNIKSILIGACSQRAPVSESDMKDERRKPSVALDIRYECSGVDWKTVSETLGRVGMAFYEPDMHRRAFEASHTTVFAYCDGRLAGFGRALSDGIYQAAVYDVAVVPEYQRRGIGTMIMKSILARLSRCNVILYASPGKEEFYRTLGLRKMKTGMALFMKADIMKEKGFTE